VRVYELHGDLLFAGAEQVLRRVEREKGAFDVAILDVTRVDTINEAARGLLAGIRTTLSSVGKEGFLVDPDNAVVRSEKRRLHCWRSRQASISSRVLKSSGKGHLRPPAYSTSSTSLSLNPDSATNRHLLLPAHSNHLGCLNCSLPRGSDRQLTGHRRRDVAGIGAACHAQDERCGDDQRDQHDEEGVVQRGGGDRGHSPRARKPALPFPGTADSCR
jgi:hypothetical protein